MPKTINDIIPPSRRKAMEMEQPAPRQIPEPPPAFDDNLPPGKFPRKAYAARRRFPFGLVIAGLVLLALAIGLLHAFSGAKVVVTPTVNRTTVSGEFGATSGSGDLPFAVITAHAVASASVPAEGTQVANDAAQGTITVYNGQPKPQQLIKNTRFESPSGLIYRIHDSITVPGGTATSPGQLAVTVYADEGGDKFNIGPSSFTVPGLKGSATFDLVYARSTESMTGGFSGTRPSVSKATEDKQYIALKPAIDSEIATALKAQVPAGYVLLPGASWTVYEPQPNGSDSAGTVSVKEKGTVTAVVFPDAALAKAVAFRTVGAYDGQNVSLGDASGLTLSPVTGKGPNPGDQSFSFNLSGSASLTWQIDSAKIAAAVAGKSRDAARTILAGFPEVEKATIILRPFWAGSYPDDPSNIQVSVSAPAAK